MDSLDTARDGLLDDALDAIAPLLLGGLTAERAEWARDVYRQIVLPSRLAATQYASEREIRQRAMVVVAETVAELVEIPPAWRWTAVKATYYRVRLTPLAEAALEQARARLSNGAAPIDGATAAGELRAQIEALVREVEAHAADVRPTLEGLLADALADCQYALGVGPGSTLLQRLVEPPPTMHSCPVCGDVGNADSRFCDQCGTRLT
jgi:hypothetical protein